MTVENLTPQAIEQFFNNPNNLYIVSANHKETIQIIMDKLPPNNLSEKDVYTLIEMLSKSINDYIVIAMRGTTNNYWYLFGDPSDWDKSLWRNFIVPTATLQKLGFDSYYKFQSLPFMSPIVQLSKK